MNEPKKNLTSKNGVLLHVFVMQEENPNDTTGCYLLGSLRPVWYHFLNWVKKNTCLSISRSKKWKYLDIEIILKNWPLHQDFLPELQTLFSWKIFLSSLIIDMLKVSIYKSSNFKILTLSGKKTCIIFDCCDSPSCFTNLRIRNL